MRQEMYKAVAGRLIRYAGQSIVRNGRVYANPSEEILYEDGFRPMGTPAEIPDYDPETQYLAAVSYQYSGNGEFVEPVYEAQDLPVIPEDEAALPTPEERIAALEAALAVNSLIMAELITTTN